MPVASTVRALLPNLLTLGNLAAGSWAIALSYQQAWALFAAALGIAMVCDWLDGFAARVLRAESPLGKELDSLADLVSFGIAPAFA
ncbi:MAG: CDP-diacylglycerol--serine O-phosphatidyltransferase, partial [Bacteroidetes bacterium]